MTNLQQAAPEFLSCPRIAVAGVSRDRHQAAGACPLMFCDPVDLDHRCVRTILGWFGRLPNVP